MTGFARDILLIQSRNFGDAVVGTGLAEAIGRSLPEARITILTRPHFAWLYRHNPFVAEIVTANFPAGTDKRFGLGAAFGLSVAIWRLRRRGFDRAIHVIGDFRETLIGWLIAPSGVASPDWAPDHPFRTMIRDGLRGLCAFPVPVAAGEMNVYAVQQRVADALGATAPARPRLYRADGSAITHRPDGEHVGLHVSASQECRRWPVGHWRDLARALLADGHEVTIFAAPSERDQLLRDYGDLAGPRLELATAPIEDFFEALGRLSAIVCLDSFSVHAAHAVGVPCVMINGANRAEFSAPPGAELIDGGAGLPCAPCLNRPTCRGAERPYRCLGDTTAPMVMERLERLRSRSRPHGGHDRQ